MLQSHLSEYAGVSAEPTIPFGVANLWVGLVILALCVLFVGFFSSSEASLLYVSKVRIRYLAERGNRAAQAVQRVLSKHDRLFATILFTENVLIIFASSVGTALALSLVGQDGIYVATIAMTVLIVIFGEITPKTFAAQNAEKVSLLMSRPIEGVIKAVSPVIWVFTSITYIIIAIMGGHPKAKSPFVTAEELRMQISIAEEEGVVARTEKRLLHKVFDFGKSRVGEVMVPRPEVVGVPSTATVGEFVAVFAESGHTQFPVFRGSLDDVVGAVSIKDVFRGLSLAERSSKTGIVEMARQVRFVPETKRIDDLFREMQADKHRMVIVIDEYGGMAGVVTIKDLVEEIVGEMHDEQEDDDVSVVRVDDRTVALDAQTRIDEANEILGINLPEGDYETVAGLVLNRLGHIPRPGEKVAIDHLKLTVTAVEGVRISQIEIQQA